MKPHQEIQGGARKSLISESFDTVLHLVLNKQRSKLCWLVPKVTSGQKLFCCRYSEYWFLEAVSQNGNKPFKTASKGFSPKVALNRKEAMYQVYFYKSAISNSKNNRLMLIMIL